MRRHVIEWLKVLVCVAYLWMVMLFALQADCSEPGACGGPPTIAEWLGKR